ncbi:related to purine nucleotide binding [Lecanosticta acicola]|uniref:ribonuclease Z n=1 Tax=Lecanosticta acicola TaxID=111012 RepID=A0AAI8YTP6_9PEZI|nr:related to purine nucleotide binding [Lecanosticta acicola]
MAFRDTLSTITAHPSLFLLCFIILIPALILLYDISIYLQLPPGPTPLPFLGSKLSIPKTQPWIKFQQWSHRYGPIFTLWIGRRPTLVISDPQIAVDLLEKRSNKYSSRPRMVVMGEVYNGNSSILTQPYGKAWSVRRKMLHQALNPKALRLYKPTQEAEASRLCFALLGNAEAWEKELERFTSSVVFCVAYGHRIDSLRAEVITERFKFMHYMASLNIPGKYLAETVPLLARLPNWLAPWKKGIQETGKMEGRANLKLLEVVKNDVAVARENGRLDEVPDSLSKLLLELRERESIPLSETHFSYVPASLFGAGSDTTASTLCSAFLALVTHPSVLRAAQAELDRVVGPERTPLFEDEAKLPYLRALCKETLRWRPVAVLGGTPHASSEEDVYEGWHIPSGTTILGNNWAINLNEDYYPQPHHFDPVRFLSDAERHQLGIEKQAYVGQKEHPSKSGHSSFGWGRRICPGADLASNSLFIALSKLLWAYDVLPSEGQEYDIFAYTDGFNVRPKKFECLIRVRSERHRNVLEKAQLDAMKWLEKFTPFREHASRPRHLRLYSSPARKDDKKDAQQPQAKHSSIGVLKDLLFGHQSQQNSTGAEQTQASKRTEDEQLVATTEPRIRPWIPRESPEQRWRARQGLHGGTRSTQRIRAAQDQYLSNGDADSDSRARLERVIAATHGEIIFHNHHVKKFLEPRYPKFFQDYVKPDHRAPVKMKSQVQILTTPTADTPGTSLLLSFDNKRYLIGSLAEGTQRASVQMGAKLLRVTECFLTGRTEWSNTGGMIGMILTLADQSSTSQASSQEEALKKVRAKAQRLGIANDKEKMRQLEDEAKMGTMSSLKIFGPPNLNHTLATARRFVFRKGMPVDIHEIRDGKSPGPNEDGEWSPFWADENMKVWALSISPIRTASPSNRTPTAVSPRKRSIDEVDAVENGTRTSAIDALDARERNYLTVKAVVSEMFNSTWRLDTLYETPLSEVRLPATIFVRNRETHKIETYRGPKPGDKPVPDPNMTVLVRKPWPGALVESLPHTEPAKEAISYIFRNHMQRGKFHPERATELKVPKGKSWAALALGESVQNEVGETITPEMVLDPSRVGGGMAVVDLPAPEYIDNLISRPEWREPKVMEGVGAIIWMCGKDVATDSRLSAFMQEFSNLEHIVSSPDYCPNNLAYDSAAAATVRLRQVDPDRYGIPVHDAESADGEQPYGGSGWYQVARKRQPLPEKVHIAARGQTVELEPAIKFQTQGVIPALAIAETVAEVPQDVMEEARKAQEAIKAPDEELERWRQSLPPGAQDAEIITLGTGSALPSKYRNVSATLVRVPGWGNMLMDCGENTLGQLRRVFTAAELKEVLRDLRLIFISHMHADHQLGTTSVIKAWYEEVHGSQPDLLLSESTPTTQSGLDFETLFNNRDRLAIVAEPAMLHWLKEYRAVEDYGYSRIAPLLLTAPRDHVHDYRSLLCWHIPHSELDGLSHSVRNRRIKEATVPLSYLDLENIEAVLVNHCQGARAVSITLTSGFKVSYSGDCRPSKDFSRIGQGSTVCIHEATFDDELAGDAKAKKHSTTSEALGVAQKMGAKACVLTHFSQRYQKVPVLERAEGQSPTVKDVPVTFGSVTPPLEEDEVSADAAENDAPIVEDDVAETFPDQETSNGTGQQYDLPSRRPEGPPEAVKFKLQSDMKVCVAFDYMRVKVGDIGVMEKLTPALLKLFAEEEEERAEAAAKNLKKDKKEKNKGKGKRNN